MKPGLDFSRPGPPRGGCGQGEAASGCCRPLPAGARPRLGAEGTAGDRGGDGMGLRKGRDGAEERTGLG